MQYPAARNLNFSTEVLAFADGSEQRFRNFPSPLKQWVVRLDRLDEEELAQLAAFHESEQGTYGSFTFRDPWDGTEYEGCHLENASVLVEYLATNYGRTQLTIQQSR